jgi:hypothetical protein
MKADQLDAPLPMRWDDEGGPCRRCGGFTHWRAPKQSTGHTHPGCERSFPELTDAAWQRVIFMVAGQLPGASYLGVEPRPAPTLREIGPCTRCGAPCQRYGRGGMSWCAACRGDPQGELSAVNARPTGPCGWCGQPGISLPGVDRYWHCREHLFPPYRWRGAA